MAAAKENAEKWKRGKEEWREKREILITELNWTR